MAQRVLTCTNFKESDGFIRSQAAAWIGKTIKENPVTAEPFVPAVEILLNNPDGKVRFWAACALAEYEGVKNPKIFEEITAGLKSANSESLAWASKEIFERAGVEMQPIVPALLAAAKASDNKNSRDWAFLAAGNISGELRNEVAEVDEALKKAEESKSWLEKINSGTATYDDLVPHLKESGDARVAAQLLGEMGNAASNAIPDMIKALKTQTDDESVNQILNAIQKIDPQAPIVRIDDATIELALNKVLNAKSKGQVAEFFGVKEDDMGPWWHWHTRDELADFANKLAALDEDAYRAFAKVILEKDPSLQDVFKSLPPE